MATFPGGVKSFTTKVSAQSIDAAHINDIQDEVTAIEDGYRNATAPLNSSGSTLATLNVTGGSTVAALNITGEIKLAGSTGTSTGQVLSYQGGSSFQWVSAAGSIPTLLAKSTNYTVLTSDGDNVNGVTIEFTGTGLSTITLYAVAGNHGRLVKVKNGSTQSTSIVTVDGNSTELIDSTLTYALNVEDSVTLQCSTSTLRWIIL